MISQQMQRDNREIAFICDTPLLKTNIVCTANGVIVVFVNENFRVNITADKAVRVLNLFAGTSLAVSSCRGISALVHPTGNIYQHQNKVEMITNEPVGFSKYAKMWQKQIFFSSDQTAVIYSLDEAGPRTTSNGAFSEMDYDFTREVFLYSSKYGSSYVPICVDIAKSAYCHKKPNGWPIWNINGIRIKMADSSVSVESENKSFFIKSTLHGKAQVSTGNVYATASGHAQSTHLYVRRDKNRVYFDGKSFIARCGKRSAGFDQEGKFAVF